MTIETHLLNDRTNATYDAITRAFMGYFKNIKKHNPEGFMDEWDMRRDNIALEIASNFNLRVSIKPDYEGYIFYDYK